MDKNELSKYLFEKELMELNSIERKTLDSYIIDHTRPEEWRSTTTSAGDLIEVSNIGNARDPATKNVYKIYYPTDDAGRYSYPMIYVESGESMYIQKVHTLVAKAFVNNDDPINKTEVNHIDSHKWNNWYKNLEYVSSSGNKWHSINTGHMHIYGEDNPNAQFTNEQIRQVCELLQAHPDWPFRLISEQTGVNVKTVGRVYRRECWKQISDEYEFKQRQIGPEIAEEICCLLDEVLLGKIHLTMREIGDLVGTSQYVVQHIACGNRWQNVSMNHIFYKMKFDKVEA